MHLRLKTKLVIAITAMVVALVTALSYVYVAQLVRERIEGAYKDGDFVSHEIYNGARAALVEADLREPRQVQEAQDDDDRADDRRDAEDLLAFDA